MGMVVTDDYYHILTSDDENWINLIQILLSNFPLSFRTPFRTSNFTPKFLIAYASGSYRSDWHEVQVDIWGFE